MTSVARNPVNEDEDLHANEEEARRSMAMFPAVAGDELNEVGANDGSVAQW